MFSEVLVRTYFLINKLCVENEENICYTSQVSTWKLVEYLYEDFYDNNKNLHSTCVAEDCIGVQPTYM